MDGCTGFSRGPYPLCFCIVNLYMSCYPQPQHKFWFCSHFQRVFIKFDILKIHVCKKKRPLKKICQQKCLVKNVRSKMSFNLTFHCFDSRFVLTNLCCCWGKQHICEPLSIETPFIWKLLYIAFKWVPIYCWKQNIAKDRDYQSLIFKIKNQWNNWKCL